jgi:murein DD-endopeptidase MepM/ murein hydrolase activator NlpD
MIKKLILLTVLLASLFANPAAQVKAQTTATGPTYLVESGDTLFSIALKFGVSANDLIQANQLTNPDVLAVGTELVIPGLEGVQGRLSTQSVPIGQNLDSLARYYQLPADTLVKLNHLTSPAEVYAGANLIIPQVVTSSMQPVGNLAPQQTVLELSAIHNNNPWLVTRQNQEISSNRLLTSDQLYTSAGSGEARIGNPLEPLITTLDLTPLPLVQGSTAVVRVKSTEPVALSGSLNGNLLKFYQDGPNEYSAIQGIHAMSEPGLADFSIKATMSNGETRELDQMLLLQDGFYPKDPPLSVPPETIDPANTKPEDDFVKTATSAYTQDKQWSGKFRRPVDEPYCIKSWYGNRRSYNGGAYTYFHTGLDFGVCANLNIYAAAPGTVVFSGPLTVRGNATIIDHGRGVYTAYYHQKESKVQAGEHVDAGQLIGEIGGTGRVTGPHLHWEVWAGGIQVNPQEWLDRVIP